MKGHETAMPTEPLRQNREVAEPFFGEFLDLLKTSLRSGGSELGLGMTLFSLAVSIRAKRIIEIGRFKGYSTLALAGALRFNDVGWDEPEQHKQRRDVNYKEFEQSGNFLLTSIEHHPLDEAAKLIVRAGLNDYVSFVNVSSQYCEWIHYISQTVDLIFFDGDHGYDTVMEDLQRFLPTLRPGGYFVLHDYFGWFGDDGENNSPIKKVCDEIGQEREHLLVDTGYQSFMVFRKGTE